MNTYKKFAPHVYLACCDQEHEKGDIISITTKYGKENDNIVHNLIRVSGEKYYYSITRLDGYDSQERARTKIEKLEGYANNASKRAEDWIEKSNEGKDFLSLGEPIKVGHHSEKRHRNLIERNWRRFSNAMDERKKEEGYLQRVSYWERMAKKINLSMPESLGFFDDALKDAEACHLYLKNNPEKRPHGFALQYAKKHVNDIRKKQVLAIRLWS